jgi:hypothetical protein
MVLIISSFLSIMTYSVVIFYWYEGGGYKSNYCTLHTQYSFPAFIQIIYPAIEWRDRVIMNKGVSPITKSDLATL